MRRGKPKCVSIFFGSSFLLFSTLSGVLVASNNGYAVAGSFKSVVIAESTAVSIEDSFSDPVIDSIIAKLRYRFSN